MKNVGIKAMLLVASILSLASCSKHFDINKKGGVRIVAEVSQKDVVRDLSDDSQDPVFLEAMELATKKHEENGGDFVALFGEAFKEAAQQQENPGARLASIFLYELKDKIDINSSNDEVLKVLRQECDDVAERSYEILTSRLDLYCKNESSFFNKIKYNTVQQHETADLIIIELPTDERIDWERVRKLFQGTAQLEFWETYDSRELHPYFADAGTRLAEDHPLFSKLQMSNTNSNYRNACVGMAQAKDTASINQMLAEAIEMNIFPRELKLAWTIVPHSAIGENGEKLELYDLVALKMTRDKKCALSGELITDACQEYGQNGQPEVTIQMDPLGAKDWKRLTGDNIGRQIAIVVDGYVYSYPVVNDEIPNGRSTISGGDMSVEEAQDLANVLKVGRLPAPIRIVEETVVKPNK